MSDFSSGRAVPIMPGMTTRPFLRVPALALNAALLGALLALGGCATTGGRATASTPSEVTGLASYYGSRFHGRPTASGELYDQEQLTAAHPSLEFGTKVKVTNLDNRRSVVVRVNDRGPFRGGRIIDLSKRAAKQLDFIAAGIAHVKVEVIGR
jgi:rare lipoprotein A